jgi:hypothetical protein
VPSGSITSDFHRYGCPIKARKHKQNNEPLVSQHARQAAALPIRGNHHGRLLLQLDIVHHPMQQMTKTSESFQLIRLALLSQAHTPSQVSHADPQDGSVLIVSSLAVQVDLPILSSGPTPTSAPASGQCRSHHGANTGRTLYPKRNDIFHNAAVNHPKDSLPRAHIFLSPYVLDALHSDSPANSSTLLKMYPRLRLRRVKEGLFAGYVLSKCMMLIPHL